jgi:polysaccharide biosynthesis protein PslJ
MTAPVPGAAARPVRPDVVSALTVYCVLLYALPSRLTIAPLGGAGPPAVIVGLGLGGWWLLERLQRSTPGPTLSHPVRRWCALAVLCVGVSYVVAMTRAIGPQEVTTANLGLVSVLSWAALLVVTEEGITSQDRLDTLLRRMVLAGGLLAALGIVQFVTGRLWVDHISIPGLVANQALGGGTSRGAFTRSAGTSLHPIEYGALLTMLLPLATNLALSDRTRSALRRWLPVALMSMAVVLAISRSAVVCAVVGMLVAAVRWSPAVRRGALLATTGLLTLVFVTIPGMLGTLATMFTGLGSDSSTLSRVDSYATAGYFIDSAPLFGRGFATFLPTYRILDNQYLLLMVEVGLVGCAAFVALMASGVRSALRARRLATDPDVATRAQGLAAAALAGAVGLAFYDGFSFPMASGTLFLVLGLAGAQLRLARLAATPRPRRTRPAAGVPVSVPVPTRASAS